MIVEKGIPMPTSGRRGRGNKSELRLTLEGMEVGDSVLTTEAEKAVAYAMQNTARAAGVRFIRRKEGEGFRIWRAE